MRPTYQAHSTALMAQEETSRRSEKGAAFWASCRPRVCQKMAAICSRVMGSSGPKVPSS